MTLPVKAASAPSTAVAPAVLPKTIPFKQDSTLTPDDGVSPFGAVVFALTVGLAGFAAWLWYSRSAVPLSGSTPKRRNWWAVGLPKNIQVRNTARLSARHSIHEIDWQGRRLLIGCAEQTITLLAEQPIAEPEGAAQKLQSVTPPEGQS